MWANGIERVKIINRQFMTSINRAIECNMTEKESIAAAATSYSSSAFFSITLGMWKIQKRHRNFLFYRKVVNHFFFQAEISKASTLYRVSWKSKVRRKFNKKIKSNSLVIYLVRIYTQLLLLLLQVHFFLSHNFQML